MNVTDDLEPEEQEVYVEYLFHPGVLAHGKTLNEGTYTVTNQDGTTGTITVKPGSSLTIWTQSTIERVP